MGETWVGDFCLVVLLRSNSLFVHLCASIKTNKQKVYTQIYILYIINNTIPLTQHVFLGVRRYSLRCCHCYKEKADGASREGSLLAEVSWVYRNKTENERQGNILI